MGSSTYPDRGRTEESPAQTGPPGRTQHDEIRFDLARHTGNVVMDREQLLNERGPPQAVLHSRSFQAIRINR